jgi:hypothetical protein
LDTVRFRNSSQGGKAYPTVALPLEAHEYRLKPRLGQREVPSFEDRDLQTNRPRIAKGWLRRCTRLKPAQQLRFFAGEFLVAQNPLAMESGKPFECGEDVAGGLSCSGTRSRWWRRGRGLWDGCPLRQ